MRAIQPQLPNPRHVEVNRILVKASPDVAWQAARHFDASTIPWVRLLFAVRSVPDLVPWRFLGLTSRCGKEESTGGIIGVRLTPFGDIPLLHTSIFLIQYETMGPYLLPH